MPTATASDRSRTITGRSRSRTAAAWSPWLLAIAVVSVGLPVTVAALSGNLTIPHNDAWSMSRIAQTFALTGHIRLLNWNDMNLIGQVVMLGPLGSSLVVQQSAVAALSVLCLYCAYRLLAVSLITRDAVLGTALLGLWPGWASLSTSFETDVPTFAATFAALLLGRRALMRDSLGWLTAALLVSFWAVSIREQAIVAPLAILVHGWLTRRSRRRLGTRNLACAAITTAAVTVGFEVWRWALPLGQDPTPTAGLIRFVGDWDALLTLGCLSGSLLVPVASTGRRAVDPLLGLFTGLAFAEIVVIGATGNGVSDRYLPALVPGTLAVILARPGTRSTPGSLRSHVTAAGHRVGIRALSRGSAAAAVVFVAVISASLAANGFAFDAARWHTAQRVATTGVPPGRIAAGLEWSGWHSPHGMIYGDGQGREPGGWELAFDRAPACVVLTPSPLRPATTTGDAGWTPAGSSSYRTFLLAGQSRLYLYRTHAPGCVA